MVPFTSILYKLTTCGVVTIEGTVSVLNFEDFAEKDWSFLDADDINSDEVYKQNSERIISAAKIGEDSSLLISTGSEGFVDLVVETFSYKQLLVLDDSLFVLACIKENYDKVKCWQGDLIYVPEKFLNDYCITSLTLGEGLAPFDVVISRKNNKIYR